MIINLISFFFFFCFFTVLVFLLFLMFDIPISPHKYFNKTKMLIKQFLLIDAMSKGKEKTRGNPTQVHSNVIKIGKKNIVSPEPKKKDGHQEGPIEFRQYVFNPQFSTPTSLPLSFFFGYQILHKMKEWEQRGHVSLFLDKFGVTNVIHAFLFI